MSTMTTAEYVRTQAGIKVQCASDAEIAALDASWVLLPTARAAHGREFDLAFEADGGTEMIARAVAAGLIHFLAFDGERRSISGWVRAGSEDEAYAKISLAL